MEETKNGLFEENEIIIHAPYNTPLERFFDTDNFEVKIFKRNGDKPIVIVRYKS